MIVENVKKVDELLWGYEEPLLVGATMVLPPEEVKVIVGDDFDEDGDDDDDNDDDDNEDGDDEDSQVRVEGHFGLLAGRNMSSEGRFSSIYIVSNGNFPLSSPLFCHCGLNDQVHNMGRWGAARIG